MLKPEAAREQLKQFWSPAFVEERIARLAGIPEALHANARSLFNLDPKSASESETRFWQNHQAAQQRAMEAFGAIKPEELELLIRTLMPELAPYVLRAIRSLERYPYSAGFGRKPFRSRNPNLLHWPKSRFLVTLFSSIGPYPPDVEWIAAWAPHAWPHGQAFVEPLLAAAIDEGDEKGRRVFDILLASARGDHEVGQMGRHVVRSLLMSQRAEGWDFMEKMLLAAQREEGLRQTILESIDEGHPEVFPRFVRLALEHDLVRFSAMVRAVDVWFGFQWDALSAGKAREILETVLGFIDDPASADAAVNKARDLPEVSSKTKGTKLAQAHEAVERGYIALWAKAFDDVESVFAPAGELLGAADANVRFVATHLLAQLGLQGGVSKAIADRLDDPDERVAARALFHYGARGYYDRQTRDETVPDLFERLERLIARAPQKGVKLAPIVWPWMRLPWGKETVGTALFGALGKRPAARLLPHLDCYDARGRSELARRLGEAKPMDESARTTLFALLGDPSKAARMSAYLQLKAVPVAEKEAPQLESLLERKAPDLRKTIVSMLLNQSDEAVLAGADRLTATKNELQRTAGLELLREMAAAGRCAEACRARAAAFRGAREAFSSDEATHLDDLLKSTRESVSLDDCLGLIDPAKRTKPHGPEAKDVTFVTPAALELIRSLDDLVHRHREQPFAPLSLRGESQEEVLLGNAAWQFPRFDPQKPVQEQLSLLPFKEIWLDWLESRPDSQRDVDGLELSRARWHLHAQTRHVYGEFSFDWLKPMEERLLGHDPVEVRYPAVVLPLLDWLGALRAREGDAKFALDGLETVLGLIPKDKLATTFRLPYTREDSVVWRFSGAVCEQFIGWAQFAVPIEAPADRVRLYHLLRWVDEPGVPIPRFRPGLKTLLHAFEVGGANEADIYDHFLGPRSSGYGAFRGSDELGWYCRLGEPEEIKQFPVLRGIVDRCRTRALEVELARGEKPTVVSQAVLGFGFSGGLDVLVRFMRGAEGKVFTRGRSWGNDSKPVVFSHVIRATYPAEGDSPERFAAQMRSAEISDDRLLELAVYAPQWAGHVEHALGWAGLAEAVWWVHAHTRDRGWTVDAELQQKWRAEVARRTPLEAEDLLDGAVDVAWFGRTYEAIGKKRWDAVYDVAKYAASGSGHKRAQLFADAMLGKPVARELVERIETKRNQDSVRALGLVPLPRGDKAKRQLLARYKALQEFLRTSRQFGSMRQASEKRAALIGMENLSRTAGYPDPIRLQWAMEAESCADLAKGPVSVTVGEVSVSLAIDSDGQPEITCTKKGKALAAIPPAVKKNARVAQLAERKTELKRSASRMRASLELAMVRGDVFSGEELAELAGNPLLWPILQRIVFIGDGIAGYPVDGGRGLADYSGKIEPLKKTESLRIAHPHDLLEGRKWSDWQKDCFRRERVQPFKQIFRELYVLTPTEAEARDISRRYSGHQVQPRQALALLGGRGWIAAPEAGVSRTFHDLGLTAWLTFQESFFTPADIEGLTLDGVRFTRRSDMHDWVQLKDIPPRVFSEVMRDLDLVVSVAHRGGVDPEASASTIQMRSALLSETLELLSIRNVRIRDSHALVKGELADYSLHLGSAVTHQLPGGALFIVPVHSQHRGRLFLPFADDDPKTAEVMSKALLLARDSQIKDPQVLAQIRAAAR